mgnify:CR=1 FL=1
MAVVKIQKIRTNFKVRFGYDESLIKHIKSTIPSDQIKTSFETLVINGQAKKDWFHICNPHGLMKIIWYCQENHILYQYENVSEPDIYKIEQYVKRKKEQIENIKTFRNTEIDVSLDDFSFMKIQPYNYQKKAYRFFEMCNGVSLLGDEMGVGKTLSAIIYSIKNNLKTIVVCPASLTIPWAKQIMLFTHEVPYIFKYQPKKKDKIIFGTPDTSKIHIVSYNALDTYLKFDVKHQCQNPYCDFEEINQIKKYKICPKCFKEKSIKSKNSDLCTFVDKSGINLKASLYELIIIDECHYIKNVKSNRYKLINSAFKKIQKKLLLSGTAIMNRPFEFFPILNFLDPFEWVNSHSFGIKYCNGSQNEFGYWNYDGHSNLEEFFERISYLYLRRLKSDPGILDELPPKTHTIIPVELTPVQLREYKKIESNVVNDLSEGDDKLVGLAKIQKLKMFTSLINVEHSLEFIQNIIDCGQKVVVFSQYIESSRRIYEHFKNNAVWYTGKKSAQDKEEARELFINDENIKVFSGTMGAAGTGIDLTSANIVIFVDLPFVHGVVAQCEDRCHRANQKNNVQIIKLICQNTIDEEILQMLLDKEKVVSKILDGKSKETQSDISIFNDVIKYILAKKKTM